MNITDRATTMQIMTAVNALGASAPKGIAESYEETNRVSAAARALGAGREDLAIAVNGALVAGRDPAKDPEVQRVLIASQIANEGVVQTVESIAFKRFREVCTANAEPLVIAWRKPFDAAATKLASCFQQIGPIPLEDTGSIMQRGGDIAAVWAEAQSATQTIESIRTGWTALAQFTRTAPINPDFRVLQLAEVSYAAWTEHTLRRRKLNPWEYQLAGLDLSLPTAAEYRDRVRTITDGIAQVESVVDRGRSHIAGHEIRVPVR